MQIFTSFLKEVLGLAEIIDKAIFSWTIAKSIPKWLPGMHKISRAAHPSGHCLSKALMPSSIASVAKGHKRSVHAQTQNPSE